MIYGILNVVDYYDYSPFDVDKKIKESNKDIFSIKKAKE